MEGRMAQSDQAVHSTCSRRELPSSVRRGMMQAHHREKSARWESVQERAGAIGLDETGMMTHWQTVRLAIGELGLQIEGPAGWVERLRHLWRGWERNTPDDPWSLSIRVGPPAPDAEPLFQAQTRFREGRCRISSPGFSGWIDARQGRADLEAHPAAKVADLDTFVRTCCALLAFDRGGLLFHAAGIARRDRGFALFGRSGSGKSTAARFSGGGHVLNDDLVLLQPANGGWQMRATPFGDKQPPQRMSTPLDALLRLVADRSDYLEPVSAAVALGELLANSPVVNADRSQMATLLDRWQDVLRCAPVWDLHFRLGAGFWEVIDAEFG